MTKGQRIRKARTDACLSQVELSSRLGISKQLLYKYETGKVTNIPSDNIELIASICGTTPEYLMGWEDELGNETLSYKLAQDIAADQSISEVRQSLLDFVQSLSEEECKIVLDFLKSFVHRTEA